MKPDPLGIHAEVERERLASRFRDGRSRGRVHPLANDIGRLVDFVAARRLRQPGALHLLRRILKQVDTEALRQLVDIVLDQGSCNFTMCRRCARLLEYCDTIDAAVALKAEFDRVAGPILDEIAANKAETARLRKQNDEDAFRIMDTSDKIH